MTKRLIADYRQARLARASNQRFRRNLDALLDAMGFPDSLPMYSSLAVDATGNVWAELYEPFPSSERESRRWCVFRAGDWALLGEVVFPARTRVLEIGDDYVLVAWYNEMDMPYIREYRLIKPAQTGD